LAEVWHIADNNMRLCAYLSYMIDVRLKTTKTMCTNRIKYA